MAQNSCEFVAQLIQNNNKGNHFQYWQEMVWIVLMNEEEEKKKKKNLGVDIVDCISSPVYKRTVNVSSVIPVMN